VNTGFQSFAEHWRDCDWIVSREKDAIHATRNGVIDKLDLFLDVAYRRAVSSYFGGKAALSQICTAFGNSFGCCIEIANSYELGYVGKDNLLTLEILWIGGLSTVVRSIGSECCRNRGGNQK